MVGSPIQHRRNLPWWCEPPGGAPAILRRVPGPAAVQPRPLPAGATEVFQQVIDNVGLVIRGKPEAIRLALTALLARGHLLIEDIPGVGKTTLARALAKSLGGTFRRIQLGQLESEHDGRFAR